MEVVQLLGSQGFWQHQVLRGVGGWGGRRYSAPKGTAACSGQYLQYSCLEDPSPQQRSLAGHSLQGCKELDTTKTILSA